MENRPKGREKNITGKGKGVYKRGEGLHTGPVGSPNGYSGRGQSASNGSQRSTRAGGGRGSLLFIIIAAVLLFGGGGLGLNGLLGGGGGLLGSLLGGDSSVVSNNTSNYGYNQQQSQTYTQTQTQGFDISSLLGGLGNVSEGWQTASNTGVLNREVDPAARAKRTVIKGNGKDTVTIMVYMCGTDLESRSGMATSDLQEMVSADLSDNVNLIVYTGGCKGWKCGISNSCNQIYKVEDGKLKCLVSDDGQKPMTDPNTLSSFIKYCTKNYKANRNELIFWDHGGGSLSGYGYDEKYPYSGSMTLNGINQALSDAGTKFDFIGFDACLMATLENALTLTPYADYLIASEETEPGVGWYYTNWLTALSDNTSMSTLDIGKKIVDDFVSYCAQKCSGQATTLSVVDLAELEKTVPSKFSNFAKGTTKLVKEDFQTVSSARGSSREFAASNKIDQVDLVDLATNICTTESKKLADVLISAVKYNKTSSNMTNAYGLSIYFPYKKASNVNNAVETYEAINLDDEYSRCIMQFASMEVGGQAVSGGASSPLSSLLGGSYSSSSSSQSTMSSDMVSQVLSGLLGGSFGNVSGLTSGNSGFLGRSLDVEDATEYISENQFDAGQLVWMESDGEIQMRLSEKQWGLVQDLELNVFIDDGEGYIDLGLDNVFEFTDDGALLGTYDGTWLAIDEQPVAYYHTGTVYDGDNYSITGRVPVMLNDSRAELILVFDNDHPYGYIAGAQSIYHDGETETVAKGMTELNEGDKIEFLCDYYGYDGSYQDSYFLGEAMTYHDDMLISNVYIDADAAQATYRFTDIYCQQYWSPVMP